MRSLPSLVALTLGLVAGPLAAARAEARPSPALEALLLATEGPARGERLSALRTLGRLRPTGVSARVAARLDGLAPADPEAVARLELVAASGDARGALAVARWVVGLRGASPPPDAERPLRRRSLVAAARALAAAPAEPGAHALRRLIGDEDPQVVRAALAVAAGQAAFDPGPSLEALLARLADPGFASDAALLALIGRSGDGRAVQPLLEALAVAAAANPRTPLPEHARALRALTGQALGDDPAAWLRWSRR